MSDFDPARLRAAREASGLTADQLAVRAGRSSSAIFKYEAGSMRPSLPTLSRLADVLDVEIGEFFPPRSRGEKWLLSDAERDSIRQRVHSLSPLTDEELDCIASVIVNAREHRQDVA